MGYGLYDNFVYLHLDYVIMVEWAWKTGQADDPVDGFL